MKIHLCLVFACGCLTSHLAFAQDEPPAKAATGRKTEKPVNFVFAKADPVTGDWQGAAGELVAQVFPTGGGKYRANLLKAFDTESNIVAALQGLKTDDKIAFSGDGWTAAIEHSHFSGSLGQRKFDLRQVERVSPTQGATPPAGAVVLFGGHGMDAWAAKAGKEWLKESGPSQWKLIEGGVMEVVPGTDCIITHRKFGDCHLHVEFRTLGVPSNSGVFLEDRYEANINETYGKLTGEPNAGFDNCTENAHPRVRPCFPPLAWQTFDIDFQAPRFDTGGKKTANASATLLFNGVKIYDHQELDVPHGAAARLGEAATGPLMLQEHGMPVQFRNIWLVETAK